METRGFAVARGVTPFRGALRARLELEGRVSPAPRPSLAQAAPLPALRPTVDAGEAADVVTLRVTREALWRWADATLAGEGATLDAGGVLVVAEMTEARR